LSLVGMQSYCFATCVLAILQHLCRAIQRRFT
jgi:hypothetical protein